MPCPGRDRVIRPTAVPNPRSLADDIKTVAHSQRLMPM